MAFTIRKVLISEPVDAVCSKILQDNGIEVTTKIGLTKDQLIEEIQHYDGLVVRSATKVTADIIAAAKELKVIGRAGTGVDNIDCNAATRHGVLVLNAPGGNTLSAAELTCGMVVTLSRNIPQACISLKSGKWDRKNFMGHELCDKTLAIIGLGKIGREVAIRMQAFGMKTVGFDPLVPPEASREFGVESYELDKLWPMADYITVHTPLIPQTKNLINADVFSKCRRGVKVVNCARGGIIDEDALVCALESGQCGGAGLDVFLEEPPKNTALIQHPKVICTPHLGASTVEAQNRVAEEIAEQFVDLLAGKFVPGVVNSPTFCHSLTEVNKPLVSLCQSVGKIAGTFVSKGMKDVSLKFTVHGSELGKKENLLSVAVLVGLLKQQLQNGANFINAPLLAKEAGIKVSAVHDAQVPNELSGYSSVVVLEVSKAETRHTLACAVEGNVALLCAIDGAAFNPPFPLAGNLIICHEKHDSNIIKEILGFLASQGPIYSASWSIPVNDHQWCLISSSVPASSPPATVAPHVNFWAQVAL